MWHGLEPDKMPDNTLAGMESAWIGELPEGGMESGENVELCAYQVDNSGQTWIPIHDCPLSESTCKLLNRVVPNGTLRGVEGEGQISPIRLPKGGWVVTKDKKQNKKTVDISPQILYTNIRQRFQ